ncbi:argininosuccinate lyase [Thiorhodovibrio winogradskyi]|uniref:Argininosuccinate lyase n=2 Tax=Thiorhodovibrio winogradskyi TaxID=77007 RepID=A0ABZ0SAY6_9GAMM
MILGAGPFQMAAIQKAVSMGLHVITVDYLPDNIGHQLGHQYVNCSTVDKVGIERAARENAVDGICTFSSDVAIPSVAAVCDRLHLPGPTQVAAETMANKQRFRAFLSGAGLPCPRFVAGRNFTEVTDALSQLHLPMIVKPVDTSGSRGVSRIDSKNLQLVERAFEKAKTFSHTNTVCVEEFIDGIEVGGDAILLDGHVAFIAITHKHLDQFVVTGHNLPTNISPEDQNRVTQAIEATCNSLNYDTGPLNFDVIVSPTTVTILEMSGRNGGNGIPAVIERATGVDVERATISLALGLSPTLPEQVNIRQGAGSFVFGVGCHGVLESLTPNAALRRQVPEIFDLCYIKQPGDRVEPFEHNGQLIGFALFDCLSSSEYERLTAHILDHLKLAVRCD